MIAKLDDQINGEHSVNNQKKMLADKKSADKSRKRTKLEEMKRQWRERESGQDSSDKIKPTETN